MKDFKILVACEESQAVTIAFRKRGFTAFSCDIQPESGGHPEWHITDDVKKVLARECWNMVIAFPPCTYLSKAGSTLLYPTPGKLNIDRYRLGLQAREFFMYFYNLDVKYRAIENPVSNLIYNLPRDFSEIQPYEFGHAFSKKTRLWLKGLPPLMPTELIFPGCVQSWTEVNSSCIKDRAKNRSKTFPGVAEAMAEQWGAFIRYENKISSYIG